MKKIFRVFCAIIITVLSFSTVVRAANYGRDFYAQNNIVWYDPSGSGSCQSSSGGSSGSSDSGGAASGAYDLLKRTVISEGETAMNMQREWGTPWEVVFAQMQVESQMGTKGVAVSGATNNWLGITNAGDDGFYQSGNHKFAKFSSIAVSIEWWGGSRVLRAGYYDAAFPYLDPDNYDIESFLKAMIVFYAPSSDGNKPAEYARTVLSLVNGPIREARESLDWPSSEELAQQENIGIGGNHPLGSDISGGGESDSSSGGSSGNCSSNGNVTISGDLAYPLITTQPQTNRPTPASHNYKANDLMVAEGTTVVAFKAGRVLFAIDDGPADEKKGGPRTNISIESDDIITTYIHMTPGQSNRKVVAGDIVDVGQELGTVGNSAAADYTPPHLHIDAVDAAGGARPGCSRAKCPPDSQARFIDITNYLQELWDLLPAS
jgi:murein DD-endopeptidase MepM/ murein hydrolase activator NlpD